ncbi:MAG: NADH-quinone oxidoreductase subunit NuoH [Chloroflexota bacterium]|nr:NADH-quinone oxidoreductase subunit NuoH [Chloroflexota bacterium]
MQTRLFNIAVLILLTPVFLLVYIIKEPIVYYGSLNIFSGINFFIGLFILVNFLLVVTTMLTFVERRLVARMQNRIGPNRVGPFGILQGFADLIKLITKEDLIPTLANRTVFSLAPILIMAPVLLMFAVIPILPGFTIADLDIGIFYVVAITSLGSLGVFAAGWASNSKYSLYGAVRGVAQLVSYEVPLVLSICVVVLLAGSLNLNQITGAQEIPFILVQPLAFVIVLFSVAAELNRTPFDLNEADSEIVAGFHTEYSGTKFALIYGTEYLAAFGWSLVIAILFLGRLEPGVGGFLILMAKTSIILFLFFWFRGTWPRVRIDQILAIAWKVMFPLATLNIIITAGEILLVQSLFDLKSGTLLGLQPLAIIAIINIVLFVALLLVLPLIKGLGRFDNELKARGLDIRGGN